MNRDITFLLGPLMAIALLAVALWHTGTALRETGAFAGNTRTPRVRADDPFVALDQRLEDPPRDLFAKPMRDPFGGPVANPTPVATTSTGPTRPVVKKPVVPPPPVSPVLTAIIYDSDPRALLRWDGRDWTVRSGGLFAEFQVVSISRDQVVLRRGEENLVLKRPQGD